MDMSVKNSQDNNWETSLEASLSETQTLAYKLRHGHSRLRHETAAISWRGLPSPNAASCPQEAQGPGTFLLPTGKTYTNAST